jgi:hypothetical protein
MSLDRYSKTIVHNHSINLKCASLSIRLFVTIRIKMIPILVSMFVQPEYFLFAVSILS